MSNSNDDRFRPFSHYNVLIKPNKDTIQVDVAEAVGKGYKDFWDYTGRYRLVKGSRGSKKSKTTALYYITKMMEQADEGRYPNLLVVRRFMNTHRDSTRAELIWAIKRLKVEHLWNIPKGDHTLTYKPTGQQILFRGLDDPQSITSITVNVGQLCWCWFEEAFQVTKESDFDKVDLSIRGAVPKGLFKQITLTFNPWSEKHWIKARFFDVPHYDRGQWRLFSKKKYDILAMTTTYMDNEFLDEDDIKVFNTMKENNPRRYKIEGLGEWGIAEGLVFDNWQQMEFDYKKIIKNSLNIHGKTHLKVRFGLDFGYTNDVAAFIACIVDEKKFKIYVFDEFYREGMTNKMLAEQIRYMNYDKELIRCDSAEPKSIDELKWYGILKAKSAKKGKDSVRQGIGRLRDYQIIVHDRCPNTVVELLNYVWAKDKKTEKVLNDPEDDYNHLMDALRYATEDIQGATFRF